MSIRRSFAASRASTGPRSAFPTKRHYVERYCERTGLTIEGDWNFYLAYNMFRIAAILQGIMKRVTEGTASSAQALDAGRRAKPMAELAWVYAQKVRCLSSPGNPSLTKGTGMNFDYTPKVQELREKLLAFFDEHIYPNERAFIDEIAAQSRERQRMDSDRV